MASRASLSRLQSAADSSVAEDVLRLAEVGVAGGVAPLDANSRIPTANMPFTSGQHGILAGAATSTATLQFDANLATLRTFRVNPGTANGLLTILPPASGTSRGAGQVLRCRVHNDSGAVQRVQFDSTFSISTGITRGPFTVPDDELFMYAIELMEYVHSSVTYLTGRWAVTAYTITAI